MFNRLKQIIKNQKGQSLVEMALITPILLILFIGVFEVGWVLRGYIVLSNANREATRFAAKGTYLDFTETDPSAIGYDDVLAHNFAALSDQLPVDVLSENPNGSVTISHFLVETNKPCEDLSSCNCDADDVDYWYKFDDFVVLPDFGGGSPQPGWVSYSRLSRTYGLSDTAHQSKFEDEAYLTQFVNQLVQENNEFNCKLGKKASAAPWSLNSVIVSEIHYDQPQLMGIPFVSNSFTDPVTLYSQTTMRIQPGSKEVKGCQVLPIGIHEDTVKQPVGTPFLDIREGDGPGNFGWLRWRDEASSVPGVGSNPNSAQYLSAELLNDMMSMWDFQEAGNPDDTELNEQDWVWGLTGEVASAKDDVESLIPDEYLIPVWDKVCPVKPPDNEVDCDASGGGSSIAYHIVAFARFKLTAVDLTGNPKTISGIFLGLDNSCGSDSDTSS